MKKSLTWVVIETRATRESKTGLWVRGPTMTDSIPRRRCRGEINPGWLHTAWAGAPQRDLRGSVRFCEKTPGLSCSRTMATFSIKSGEREQLKSLQSKARSAGRELEDAVNAYNDAVANAFAELKQKADEYNDAIRELSQECDEVHSQLTDIYESRSETWQEGDGGDAFRSWLEEWEIEFDEFDYNEPDELDFDEDHSSQVYDLMPAFDLDY